MFVVEFVGLLCGVWIEMYDIDIGFVLGGFYVWWGICINVSCWILIGVDCKLGIVGVEIGFLFVVVIFVGNMNFV